MADGHHDGAPDDNEESNEEEHGAGGHEAEEGHGHHGSGDGHDGGEDHAEGHDAWHGADAFAWNEAFMSGDGAGHMSTDDDDRQGMTPPSEDQEDAGTVDASCDMHVADLTHNAVPGAAVDHWFV